MYFKKLELFGFKSFLDKTTVNFEPGVTAFVGPNGCGKSNISDAIRWVLGEQSAKSLRGSNMEDIIFSGSALKEPVNLAEVSLTLSNESKLLAIDYDEVTISRRLYRSGESEYLINKNVVRLKDIHGLLLGTGIGTESYSIIEQGEMDAILNSKPEDRRAIFEEAAGITKFKSKKKEALRKLEQTENNLLRIHDIVQEVKRQIGSIERQAKKAEHYKIEFAKLKELELALASREFLLFETRRKSKEEGLAELRTKEQENLSQAEEIESRYNQERQRLDETDEAVRQYQEEEWKVNSEIRSRKDKALLNRERIGECLARRESHGKDIQTARRRMEELTQEFENLGRELEAYQNEEREGLAFFNSLEAEGKTEGKAPIPELETKIRDFKNRLCEILKLADFEARLDLEIRAFAEELMRLQAQTKEKETLLTRLAEARSRQEFFEARREKTKKSRSWVLESRLNEETRALGFEKEAGEAVSKKEVLEAENHSIENELSALTVSRDEILRQKEAARLGREVMLERLEALDRERNEKTEFLKTAQGRVHAFELERVQVSHEIERLKERIFNAYQVDLVVEISMRRTESESVSQWTGSSEFDAEKIKQEIQEQRERMNRMGPVNLVAIQEYDEMKTRYDFLTQQEQDLLKAKEDLHKAIQKINRTTRELFADTFQKIQKNFTEYFRLLFEGGHAELVLLDESDVLESGIEIVARPPGKKLQNISLLSGGEKALTAVALLFSVFKVKPSPFCVLDEIDAPLDDPNVDRFCNVLKEFIAQSQFILITHNKRTMNLADAMYGITMAQTGISKIVSVRFSEKVKQEDSAVLV